MNITNSKTPYGAVIAAFGSILLIIFFFLPWISNEITFGGELELIDPYQLKISGKDLALEKTISVDDSILPSIEFLFGDEPIEINLFELFEVDSYPWLLIIPVVALISLAIAVISLIQAEKFTAQLSPVTVASGLISFGLLLIVGYGLYTLQTSDLCEAAGLAGDGFGLIGIPLSVEACSIGYGYILSIIAALLILVGGILNWFWMPLYVGSTVSVPEGELGFSGPAIQDNLGVPNNQGGGLIADTFYDPEPETAGLTARATLHCQSGEWQGRTFNIVGTTFVIGRRQDNHLILSEVQVSKEHASIRFSHGRYFIQNKGRGGTFVNGQMVQATSIQSGDQIRIGSSVFVFRY